MFLFLLISIACFSSGAISLKLFEKCEITDMGCIEKSANAAIPLLMSENSEYKVPSSDPLDVEKIEGNLSILKFNFYNSTHTGFKNCYISNLKMDADITKVYFDLNCPKMSMAGSYEASGRLIVLPVEGSGVYSLTTGKYIIDVEMELKKIDGEDGKTHIAVKNFKLKPTPLEPMDFVFKNLFNGQKDLSDTVHKFAHDNWKEVANLVQDPIWYACIKKATSNVNKYMKNIPLEDIIEE